VHALSPPDATDKITISRRPVTTLHADVAIADTLRRLHDSAAAVMPSRDVTLLRLRAAADCRRRRIFHLFDAIDIDFLRRFQPLIFSRQIDYYC